MTDINVDELIAELRTKAAEDRVALLGRSLLADLHDRAVDGLAQLQQSADEWWKQYDAERVRAERAEATLAKVREALAEHLADAVEATDWVSPRDRLLSLATRTLNRLDTILGESPTEREAPCPDCRGARGYYGKGEPPAWITCRCAEQETPTDEWEWGACYEADNGREVLWFSMGGGGFAIREAAEREVERYGDVQIRLCRRRKAGPWEVVPDDRA